MMARGNRTHALVASPAAALGQWIGDPGRHLAPYERERARALRIDRDRNAYVAAHLLARRAAARLLGVDAASIVLKQRCDHCGGPHGRPAVEGHPEVHVSLSHSDAVVAAAASPGPVAIDVEPWSKIEIGQLRSAGVFSQTELAALDAAADALEARQLAARLWVLKECLIKLGRLSLDTLHRGDFGACVVPGEAAGRPRRFEHLGLVFSEHSVPEEAFSLAAAADGPVDFEFLLDAPR